MTFTQNFDTSCCRAPYQNEVWRSKLREQPEAAAPTKLDENRIRLLLRIAISTSRDTTNQSSRLTPHKLRSTVSENFASGQLRRRDEGDRASLFWFCIPEAEPA